MPSSLWSFLLTFNNYHAIPSQALHIPQGKPRVTWLLTMQRSIASMSNAESQKLRQETMVSKFWSVYASGSKNMSYDSASLTTPGVQWLGLWPSDLNKYQLSDQCQGIAARRFHEEESQVDEGTAINVVKLIATSKKKGRDWGADCHPSLVSRFGARDLQQRSRGGTINVMDTLTSYYIKSTNLRILCTTLRQLPPPAMDSLIYFFVNIYASTHTHLRQTYNSKSRLWGHHVYSKLLRRNKMWQLYYIRDRGPITIIVQYEIRIFSIHSLRRAAALMVHHIDDGSQQDCYLRGRALYTLFCSCSLGSKLPKPAKNNTPCIICVPRFVGQ